MLAITTENARKWIIAASVVYFLFAAVSFLFFGVVAYSAVLPAGQLIHPFLDCCIYVVFGMLVLRGSRFGATFGFGWYVMGLFCNFDYIMRSSLLGFFFTFITLGVFQGMRATHYLYMYKNSGEWIKPEDLYEVIDADYEEVLPYKDQSQSTSV
jgi:hypothetical protein